MVPVRHARPDDLRRIESLVDELRAIDGLVERTPGSFYRWSTGFLHFHIDGDDVYCDVKLSGSAFDRVRATTPAEQQELLAAVRQALANGGAPSRDEDRAVRQSDAHVDDCKPGRRTADD
jgi:hypothetical protein